MPRASLTSTLPATGVERVARVLDRQHGRALARLDRAGAEAHLRRRRVEPDRADDAVAEHDALAGGDVGRQADDLERAVQRAGGRDRGRRRPSTSRSSPGASVNARGARRSRRRARRAGSGRPCRRPPGSTGAASTVTVSAAADRLATLPAPIAPGLAPARRSTAGITDRPPSALGGGGPAGRRLLPERRRTGAKRHDRGAERHDSLHFTTSSRALALAQAPYRFFLVTRTLIRTCER